jgi:hypothetical protein
VRQRAHDAARVGFAALGFVAVADQFARLEARGPVQVGNFFSYFTIQSSLAAATTLAFVAIVRRDERSLLFDALRGAATLYILITGVVFTLLLSSLARELDSHNPFANVVLHDVLPLVLLADWLLDPPRHRLGPKIALAWLAYPLAWFAYTLVRGSAVHWYPYPFVDPTRHGYGGVLVRAALFAVSFAAGALALSGISARRRA